MNPEAIIECVPNFSEGTDAAKVSQIVAAMQVEGVRLLDWSLDKAHNRSVVTIAGTPAGVVEAAVRAAGKAAELIDLTKQNGVHPRIGAADVIPFIPVSGASLAECAVLARQAGLLIWRRYGVPVYFYGAAAARPDRVQLEDVRTRPVRRPARRRPPRRLPPPRHRRPRTPRDRRGQRRRSPQLPHRLQHPSQREPDIAAARAIARDIRAANGGLHGVKAIGVLANGRAQVSMNVTDFNLTPMRHVHATIQHLAQRHGVLIDDAELIGLIPEAAYEPDAEWVRQIPGFDPDGKVLERKLNAPIAWP